MERGKGCLVCGSPERRWVCPCESGPVYCGDACAARHWSDHHKYEHVGVKGKRTRNNEESEGSVSDPDTPLTLVAMADKTLTVPWKYVKQCRTLKDLMEDNPNVQRLPVPNVSVSTLSKVFELIQTTDVPDFDTIDELFQFVVALNYLGVTVSDDIYQRAFGMIGYRFGKPLEMVEDYQAFFGDALNLPFPPELFVKYFVDRKLSMYLRPSHVLKIYDLTLRASMKNAIRNYMMDYFKKEMPHVKDPEDCIACLRYFGNELTDNVVGWAKDIAFFDIDIDHEFIKSWKGYGYPYKYPYRLTWVMDAIIARLGSFQAWKTLAKGEEDRKREKERERDENYKHLKAVALGHGFRIDYHFSDKQIRYVKEPFLQWLRKDDFKSNVEEYQRNLKQFLAFMEEIVEWGLNGPNWTLVYEYTTPEKYLEIAKKYKK